MAPVKPPPRGSSLLRPVGKMGSAVYWRRRLLAVAVLVAIAAVVSAGVVLILRSAPSSSPATTSTTDAQASKAPAPRTTPSTTASSGATKSVDRKTKDKKAEKKAEPSWTPVPGANRQDGDWADYPWGSNGLECPPPADSPAAGRSPSEPGVVVILGDSLVRDARESIASSLASYGMDAQFVCWGGKNLEWGLAQVEAMRSLNLLPACLVVNLGTNDLKGTTANGLADAVSLPIVSGRLRQILLVAADIRHVFAVDIAADLSRAPSTMTDVGQAPQAWQDAVSATGVGEVIPWASRSSADPSLIGSDGIHDSGSGQQVRAQLIADYVAPYCAP